MLKVMGMDQCSRNIIKKKKNRISGTWPLVGYVEGIWLRKERNLGYLSGFYIVNVLLRGSVTKIRMREKKWAEKKRD